MARTIEAAKRQGISGTKHKKFTKKSTNRYNRRQGKKLLEDAPNHKQRYGWVT